MNQKRIISFIMATILVISINPPKREFWASALDTLLGAKTLSYSDDDVKISAKIENNALFTLNELSMENQDDISSGSAVELKDETISSAALEAMALNNDEALSGSSIAEDKVISPASVTAEKDDKTVSLNDVELIVTEKDKNNSVGSFGGKEIINHVKLIDVDFVNKSGESVEAEDADIDIKYEVKSPADMGEIKTVKVFELDDEQERVTELTDVKISKNAEEVTFTTDTPAPVAILYTFEAVETFNYNFGGVESVKLRDILRCIGIDENTADVEIPAGVHIIQSTDGNDIVLTREAGLGSTPEQITVTTTSGNTVIINVKNEGTPVLHLQENNPTSNWELMYTGGGNVSDDSTAYDGAAFKNYDGTNASVTIEKSHIWDADTSDEKHRFLYTLRLIVAGAEYVEPGDMVIRLPLHILRDKDGNYADEFDISVPTKEVYDNNTDGTNFNNVFFSYVIEGDEVIITNRKRIPAGETQNMPFSYATTKKTWEYQDMGLSDPVNVEVIIKSNAENDDTPIASIHTKTVAPVCIDTSVEIKQTKKSLDNNGIYYQWQDSWGDSPDPHTVTVDDKEEEKYVYFLWRIDTEIESEETNPGKITQSYNFNLNAEDFKFTGTAETPADIKGDIIGLKMSGRDWNIQNFTDSTFNAAATAENLNEKNGTKRTDYVLTRYEKSLISETDKEYTFVNDVTGNVTPKDGVDPATNSEAKATLKYKAPKYEPPESAGDLKKFGLYSSKDYVVSNESNVSSYALDKLKNDSNVSKLRYHVTAWARELPSTFDHTQDYTLGAGDIPHFEEENVTYTLEDNKLYIIDLSDEDKTPHNLTENDYYFTSLETNVEIAPMDYDSDKMQFMQGEFGKGNYVSLQNKPADIYLNLKTAGGDYVQAAKYDAKAANGWEMLDSSYISSISGGNIYFKSDAEVSAWKLVSENPYYYTKYDVYPTVTLKATDNVKSAIDENSTKIALYNTADFKVEGLPATDGQTTLGDKVIKRQAEKTDRVYISQIERHSHITKKFVPTDENDIMNGNYKAPWEVTAYEDYLDENNQTQKVLQNGGTFYDVLPIVSVPKLDSIEVYADGTLLTYGDYTYEASFQRDYAGHNRVMLKIDITKPAYQYDLKLRTIHTHDDIMDYGKYITNSVAYETGNEDIADGYPDNGGNISEGYLLENLDPTTNARKFIYSSATHTIPALIFSVSGIDKKVAKQGEVPDRSAVVNPGDYYSYTYRYKNDTTYKSKEIVVMDSIENFYDEGEKQGDETYISNKHNGSDDFSLSKKWQGTPVGFDVQNLIAKGVPYKIYIYNGELEADFNSVSVFYAEEGSPFTKEKRDEFNESFTDMFFTGGWEEYIVPVNPDIDDPSLADITAFALVLDKDYKMNKGESFSIKLRMKAPEDVSDINGKKYFDSSSQTESTIDTATDKKIDTYNNVFLHALASSDDSFDYKDHPETSYYFYTHQDYTTVSLRVDGDVHIEKLDSLTLKPIEGVTFNLYGTSFYGTYVDKDIVSNSNGEISFEDIEMGTYTLTETDSTADYQKCTDRTVIIDNLGKVTISGVNFEGTDGTDFVSKDGKKFGIIKDDKRYHADLSFLKVNSENQNRISGAEFTLTTVNNGKDHKTDYGNEYTATQISEGGEVNFENIEIGTYILKETKAAAGYAPEKREYWVKVYPVDNTTTDVKVYTDSNMTTELTQQNNTYVVGNTPEAGFLIKKRDAVNNSITLIGAEFTLIPDTTTQNLMCGENTEKWTKVFDDPENSESWHYEQKVGTGPGGYAEFKELIKGGKYTLKETKAPTNYTAGADIAVTVDPEGNVTVGTITPVAIPAADRSTNYKFNEEEYPIDNVRAYNSEVTVVKKWIGDPMNNFDGTDFPKINISNQEKKAEKKYVTLFYSYSEQNNSNSFKKCFSGDTVEFVRLDKQPKKYANIEDVQKDYPITFTDVAQHNDITFKYNNANNTESTISFECSKEKGNAYLGYDSSTKKTYFWTDAETVYFPPDCYEFLRDKMKNITGNLDFSGFSFERVVRANHMLRTFGGTSIDLSGMTDTPNLLNANDIFKDSTNLQYINMSNWTNAPNLKTMQSIFQNCSALKEVYLPNLKAENIRSIKEVFSGCKSIQRIVFGNSIKFDSQNTREENSTSGGEKSHLNSNNMYNTFLNVSQNIGTSNEAILDLSALDTQYVIYMGQTFSGANKVKTIYVNGNWNTESLKTNDTGKKNMFNFNANSKITGGNGTVYNSEYNSEPSYARIDTAESPGYFTRVDKTSAEYSNFLGGFNTLSGYDSTGGSGSSSSSETETPSDTSEDPEPVVTYSTKTPQVSESTNDEGKYYTVKEEISVKKGEQTDTYDSEARWYKNNSNEWVCVIKVFDPDAKYYVWEDDDNLTGYTSEAFTGVEMEENTRLVTITNTKTTDTTPPEYGDLSLKKKVVRAAGGAEVTPTANDGFEFTVTLTKGSSDANFTVGDKYHFGTTDVFTATTASTLEATISLNAGKTVTFKDIPTSYTYSVTETAKDGYTDGTKTGTSGSISKDTTAEASWENVVEETNFKVTKNYVSKVNNIVTPLTAEEAAEEFTVMAEFTGLLKNTLYEFADVNSDGVNDTYRISSAEYNDETHTQPNYFYTGSSGTAAVEFKLKHGQTVYFDDIPIGAKYRVTETDWNDCQEHEIVFTDGTEINTVNPGEITAKKYAADYTAAFTVNNTKTSEKTVNVAVQKVWKGTDGNVDTDEHSNRRNVNIYLYLTYPGSVMRTAYQTTTLSDGNGWQDTFADLPTMIDGNECIYSVDEVSVSGYETEIVSKVGELTYRYDENIETENASLSDENKLDTYALFDGDGNRYTRKLTEKIFKNSTGTEVYEEINGCFCDVVSGNKVFILDTIGNKITDPNGNVSYVVTNTEVPTYSLTINKNVGGNMGNKAKQFRYKVELETPEGEDYSGIVSVKKYSGNDTANSTISEVVFTNGMAVLSLTHNQSAVILGLAAGTKYKVTEMNADDYNIKTGDKESNSADPLTYSEKEDNKNVIEGTLGDNTTGKDMTVGFQNSINAIVPTGITEHPAAAIMLCVIPLIGIIILLIKKHKYV